MRKGAPGNSPGAPFDVRADRGAPYIVVRSRLCFWYQLIM